MLFFKVHAEGDTCSVWQVRHSVACTATVVTAVTCTGFGHSVIGCKSACCLNAMAIIITGACHGPEKAGGKKCHSPFESLMGATLVSLTPRNGCASLKVDVTRLATVDILR